MLVIGRAFAGSGGAMVVDGVYRDILGEEGVRQAPLKTTPALLVPYL
jgi:hypothetical protein